MLGFAGAAAISVAIFSQASDKWNYTLTSDSAGIPSDIFAHALLFKLHVPSRYTGMSLRIIMALAAGMAFLVILDVFHYGTAAKPAGTAAVLGTGAVA